MADFNKCIEVVLEMEFKSIETALSYNKGEQGLTFMGIYQGAHPALQIWDICFKKAKQLKFKVDNKETMYTQLNKEQLKQLSKICYKDKELQDLVKKFYKKQFWDKIKGDLIKENKKALLILDFAVNAGVRTAVKKAQKIIKAKVDGIVGMETITKLNIADTDMFSCKYTLERVDYYNSLITKSNRFKEFLHGWVSRALIINKIIV